MNPYPAGCNERTSSDPASPFFTGHNCDGCGGTEYNCKCEELALTAQIDSLSEKIETLEKWAAESSEFSGINFIEREIKALLYSYTDQISRLEREQ